MGGVAEVRHVLLGDVAPVELPRGGWSRMLLTGDRVGSGTSLGVSSFAPGTCTAMLNHVTDEVCFVVSGRGELLLDDSSVAYGPGSALFIPAGAWHAVASTGDEPVVMVFGFDHPDYPPTERRPVDSAGGAR